LSYGRESGRDLSPHCLRASTAPPRRTARARAPRPPCA